MCSAIRRGRNRHLESFARVAAPLPWPAPNPREQIKNTPPRRIAFAQVCVPLLIPSTCPLSVPHLPFPRLITLPSPSPNLVLKKRRRPRASATATSRVSHGRLRLSRGLRPGRASKLTCGSVVGTFFFHPSYWTWCRFPASRTTGRKKCLRTSSSPRESWSASFLGQCICLAALATGAL